MSGTVRGVVRVVVALPERAAALIEILERAVDALVMYAEVGQPGRKGAANLSESLNSHFQFVLPSGQLAVVPARSSQVAVEFAH